MSRGLAAALSGGDTTVLRPAIFVEFQFKTGTSYFWSGEASKTWDGKTWTGGGLLGEIKQSGEGEKLQARQLIFTLNGVDGSFYATAQAEAANLRGQPVKMWWALLNDSETVIWSYLVEEARMDTLSIQESGDSIQLSLSCESELVDFFRANTVYWTDPDHQRIYPGDKFCEFVSTLPNKELRWGLDSGTTTPGITPGGNYADWLRERRRK